MPQKRELSPDETTPSYLRPLPDPLKSPLSRSHRSQIPQVQPPPYSQIQTDRLADYDMDHGSHGDDDYEGTDSSPYTAGIRPPPPAHLTTWRSTMRNYEAVPITPFFLPVYTFPSADPNRKTRPRPLPTSNYVAFLEKFGSTNPTRIGVVVQQPHPTDFHHLPPDFFEKIDPFKHARFLLIRIFLRVLSALPDPHSILSAEPALGSEYSGSRLTVHKGCFWGFQMTDNDIYVVPAVKFDPKEDTERDNLIDKLFCRTHNMLETVNQNRLYGIPTSYSPEMDEGQSYQFGPERSIVFRTVYMIEEDKVYNQAAYFAQLGSFLRMVERWGKLDVVEKGRMVRLEGKRDMWDAVWERREEGGVWEEGCGKIVKIWLKKKGVSFTGNVNWWEAKIKEIIWEEAVRGIED